MKSPQTNVIVIVLVFLAVTASYYKILPSVSSTTTYVVSSVSSNLQTLLTPASFCTKDIGEGMCCDLHMGAEPCLDECRKQFVDRQTFQLTREYEDCADRCLVMYSVNCGKGAEGKPKKQLWDGEIDNEMPAPIPRVRG